jgi:hypothetical protein
MMHSLLEVIHASSLASSIMYLVFLNLPDTGHLMLLKTIVELKVRSKDILIMQGKKLHSRPSQKVLERPGFEMNTMPSFRKLVPHGRITIYVVR